ncbi:hypothetical protein [Streptomyces sp. NPDC050546]|uniref:hypothetical protein n=1 Tax=Streptomyces sp. NPDC050546 TaxID=3365628 RepID=UPI0037BAA99C
MYNSTLAGALECLDSGITTQLDFAHIAYSPELADAAVDALRAAGLRAVFGYGTPVDVTEGGKLTDVRRIRERLADDNALVTMAYAPLGPLATPMETVAKDWRSADEMDLPLTIQLASTPLNERPLFALRDAGLLREKTVYVHGNGIGDDELKLIGDSGATASATPGDEADSPRGREGREVRGPTGPRRSPPYRPGPARHLGRGQRSLIAQRTTARYQRSFLMVARATEVKTPAVPPAMVERKRTGVR